MENTDDSLPHKHPGWSKFSYVTLLKQLC